MNVSFFPFLPSSVMKISHGIIMNIDCFATNESSIGVRLMCNELGRGFFLLLYL